MWGLSVRPKGLTRKALRVLAPQQPGGPPPVASLPQLPRGGSQGPPLPQMPVNAAASLPTLAPVLPTAPTEPALATPSALPAPTAQPVSMAPVTSTPSATAQPPEAPTTQPTAPFSLRLCKLYDMGGCTKGADCPNCHGQEDGPTVTRMHVICRRMPWSAMQKEKSHRMGFC
eukprot:g18698.t1